MRPGLFAICFELSVRIFNDCGSSVNVFFFVILEGEFSMNKRNGYLFIIAPGSGFYFVI